VYQADSNTIERLRASAARNRVRRDLRQHRLTSGLVSKSITHREARATVLVQPGGLKGVLSRPAPPRKPPPTAARGCIYGFSRKSQQRMNDFLMGVDWSVYVVYFITLTYHHGYGDDWEVWKRHLDMFIKRLFRRYKGAVKGLIWKEEFQARGAPHFHLCVFFDRKADISQMRAWVSFAWNEIAEPGDVQHLAAGTQVVKARNTNGPNMGRFMRYLSKYMGKQCKLVDAETGEVMPTGRMWGYRGEVPRPVAVVVRLDEHDWARLMRRIRRWGQASAYLSKLNGWRRSARVFGDGVLLFQLLRGLTDRPPDLV